MAKTIKPVITGKLKAAADNGSDLNQSYTVETVKLSALKPHPKNYRAHPEDQIEHLIQSIKEHGFYHNIVIANDGTILIGHGLTEAARKMGLKTIPVICLDIGPDDPKALKLLASDNEIAHLGMVDDRALSELLRDIKDNSIGGLLGTGYDDKMLANLVMVTRPQSEIRDINHAAEWAGMPEYEQRDERAIRLMLIFDGDHQRQDFMDRLEIIGTSKAGTIISARWPPQGSEDIKSVFIE